MSRTIWIFDVSEWMFSVSADYRLFNVSKFGCSERAVLRGENGTGKIPRYSNSPLKFIKAKVDAAFDERKKKPVKVLAAEIRKTNKKRIYSTVKKQTSAEQSI